jgi:predicted nucleic acid-binding protein
MVFVDSNVPMYLIGEDHPHKIDSQRLIERLSSERRRLVTSSEVFQELLHRYMAPDRREAIEVAFHTLQSIVDNVFSVREEDVVAAKDLTHAHPRLSARDAMHAAVMRRNRVSQILSFDRGFDLLPSLTRIPGPAQPA